MRGGVSDAGFVKPQWCGSRLPVHSNCLPNHTAQRQLSGRHRTVRPASRDKIPFRSAKKTWRREGSSHRQACRVPSTASWCPPACGGKPRGKTAAKNSLLFLGVFDAHGREVPVLRVFCPRSAVLADRTYFPPYLSTISPPFPRIVD